VDGGIRQTQHLAHGQRCQRVVHAELAGHIHLDVHLVLAGNVEGNAQKIVGAQQLVAGLAVVGLFIAAIGDQLAGVALQQSGGVLVVDVHQPTSQRLNSCPFQLRYSSKVLCSPGPI